jgi:NCS1 family nucleobase:cation symporter-1
MFVSPQKIRWLFLAKATVVPPTWLALLIWAFVKVPPKSGLFARKTELGGSELSWAWLSALNSAIGVYATLGVNIPDFTVGHTLFYRVALISRQT